MVRIHNRPAYNSECHATREMGIGELNNSYEDAELADVHLVDRRQPVRDPDQLLPRHWVPNLQGGTVDKKKKWFPGEPRRPAQGRSSSTRAARRPLPSPSRSPARTTCCIWTSSRAPTSRCSTACSPTWSSRAGSTRTSSPSTRTASTPPSQANKLSLDECSQITGVPVDKLQPGRRMGLQAQGDRHSRRAPCTPTRRASSGATTTI